MCARTTKSSNNNKSRLSTYNGGKSEQLSRAVWALTPNHALYPVIGRSSFVGQSSWTYDLHVIIPGWSPSNNLHSTCFLELESQYPPSGSDLASNQNCTATKFLLSAICLNTRAFNTMANFLCSSHRPYTAVYYFAHEDYVREILTHE